MSQDRGHGTSRMENLGKELQSFSAVEDKPCELNGYSLAGLGFKL
jgi:hypothetical protein